ncbi:Gfo/Idh/MocA family protein [Ruegeria meonggei]|uniref:Glucose--fructose oxidoreductase n=1 Tax=Ruegeria meonggei TaxID=1446476 RepID=A0A1X6YVR7_9RHOB|nr:Gfo/Idh/MocA family oxidoreductase [Ruegeria meonggei]SLN32345.1 Glucose--fructose oxidoreductase precursor [Ruegeria meonggei]
MINIAILGAGIGSQHLDALRQLGGDFRVAAIVDKDVDRIEKIRASSDFAAMTDIADALADPQIDVIDICLPPHLHVPVTLDALAVGKHVVCEKPLATSMADADRMKAAAKHAGRQIFPVFQYRWGPAFAQLRHLQTTGLTGQIHTAALETHWSRGADYYAIPWRGTWEGERGGAVLGHAIHNHDLLTHLAGPVASVSAMATTRVNPIETEDCAAIAFSLTSGALCTSNITLGAATDETRLRLVFEHLTATSGVEPYAPGSAPWTFTARDPSDQAVIDAALNAAPCEPAGFQGFFTEIAKALNGAPNAAVTLEDGIASVALVTAIYHAARTGDRVTLPIPPDHPLYQGWLP